MQFGLAVIVLGRTREYAETPLNRSYRLFGARRQAAHCPDPASPLPVCGRAAFFVNQHEFEQVLDIAIRSAPVYVDEAYSREGK